MREKVVWSSVNDPAEGLALTTAIRGDKESFTEPTVTEQHIATVEEGKGGGEENVELLINYDNTDTKIIGELMKKVNLPKPKSRAKDKLIE